MPDSAPWQRSPRRVPQPRQQRYGDRGRGSEGEHPRVPTGPDEPRYLVRDEDPEQVQALDRDHRPDGAAGQGEQQSLGQDHARELRAAGAESGADRQLAAAAESSGSRLLTPKRRPDRTWPMARAAATPSANPAAMRAVSAAYPR